MARRAVTLALGVWVVAAAMARAEGPVEFALTPQDGPFLIYVASFRGDSAAKLAHDLTHELRTRYRLKACIFLRADEAARAEREALLATQRRRLEEPEEGPPGAAPPPDAVLVEAPRFRRVRVLDEFAVFVGDFKTQDEAKTKLDAFKRLEPPQSVPQFGVHLYRDPRDGDAPVAPGRRGLKGERVNQAALSPFWNAFVVRNPLLTRPAGTAAAPRPGEFDPAWLQLNAAEKFPVYACPKPYTLVVQVFEPIVMFTDGEQPGLLGQITGAGAAPPAQQGPPPAALAAAASHGRKLAEMLRDGGRGFETYVLHTRAQTVVTVGGFDRQNDPALLAAASRLSNLQINDTYRLLAVPRPMPVPRPPAAPR